MPSQETGIIDYTQVIDELKTFSSDIRHDHGYRDIDDSIADKVDMLCSMVDAAINHSKAHTIVKDGRVSENRALAEEVVRLRGDLRTVVSRCKTYSEMWTINGEAMTEFLDDY